MAEPHREAAAEEASSPDAVLEPEQQGSQSGRTENRSLRARSCMFRMQMTPVCLACRSRL